MKSIRNSLDLLIDSDSTTDLYNVLTRIMSVTRRSSLLFFHPLKRKSSLCQDFPGPILVTGPTGCH
uniref:Uncharacterized protein n=1 Tax=Picea glauca TaxID=3330 RepID=A0A124GNC6_PICGL|nr:hypothetical protein ABT39_MTgene5396 [Picea glauca]